MMRARKAIELLTAIRLQRPDLWAQICEFARARGRVEYPSDGRAGAEMKLMRLNHELVPDGVIHRMRKVLQEYEKSAAPPVQEGAAINERTLWLHNIKLFARKHLS